jgi:hypothetical protein
MRVHLPSIGGASWAASRRATACPAYCRRCGGRYDPVIGSIPQVEPLQNGRVLHNQPLSSVISGGFSSAGWEKSKLSEADLPSARQLVAFMSIWPATEPAWPPRRAPSCGRHSPVSARWHPAMPGCRQLCQTFCFADARNCHRIHRNTAIAAPGGVIVVHHI